MPGRLPQAAPESAARSPAERGRDNRAGAALMCVAMTFFTLNDAVMKFVAQSLPLYQAITLRGAGIMVMLALVARAQGGLDLRIPPENRTPMLWRTVGEVSSTVLFLNALKRMEMADLSAIMQSLPLLVTLAAALLFAEPLGWRRIAAILAGLAGVMMILRPGTSAFDIWSLVALASVAGVVVRDLATRRFGAATSSSAIAFYAAGSVTVSALGLSLGQGWTMPSPAQAGLLLLASGLLTVGYVTIVASMRVGEIGAVAPFRYTSLVVAILLGLAVFGDWPDGWTWAGSALVVTAGVYAIWREGGPARPR